MDHVNLKRLAEELKLSPSTVSRALRDSHEISKSTKERVRTLAEKLNFHPNPHASSLRQSKSKTIALIMPEIQNNFFSQVMNGIEEIAHQKGYHVLIYLSHENYSLEKDILNVLHNGRVDGLMISVSNDTCNVDHLKEYKESGIPLVFFDRVCEEIDAPGITTDDNKASFKATELLLRNGCKKIAFLSMAGNLSISSRRKSGYLKALAKHRLADNALTIECGPDDEKNRQLIQELLKSKQKPDGIFAAVEKFAVNSYEVCHELKIRIPEDIKIIGFSNLSAAALFQPSLSTIVQPAYEMGREAAAILFRIIENKKLLPGEKKIVIPSYIVERKSTSR